MRGKVGFNKKDESLLFAIRRATQELHQGSWIETLAIYNRLASSPRSMDGLKSKYKFMNTHKRTEKSMVKRTKQAGWAEEKEKIKSWLTTGTYTDMLPSDTSCLHSMTEQSPELLQPVPVRSILSPLLASPKSVSAEWELPLGTGLIWSDVKSYRQEKPWLGGPGGLLSPFSTATLSSAVHMIGPMDSTTVPTRSTVVDAADHISVSTSDMAFMHASDHTVMATLRNGTTAPTKTLEDFAANILDGATMNTFDHASNTPNASNYLAMSTRNLTDTLTLEHTARGMLTDIAADCWDRPDNTAMFSISSGVADKWTLGALDSPILDACQTTAGDPSIHSIMHCPLDFDVDLDMQRQSITPSGQSAPFIQLPLTLAAMRVGPTAVVNGLAWGNAYMFPDG